MATDRQTFQRIIIEHTEISMITTKMEYLVPDPLSLRFQTPVGRVRRYGNSQPAWLPPESQDVNSSNDPDILAQNARHPSGIDGICRDLDTSLFYAMSYLGPTLSNLEAPHVPVHADFLNTNQSVSESTAHNGANIQNSFSTIQSPSYTTSYSNVNLQEDTAYSSLLEPQATLPTIDFDPYETNDMGGFTIKEESLDCGYSPYTVLPHQQPLNIANNSELYPIMTAEAYNDRPLCPFPQIEPRDLASSGTSATLNVLAEQQSMSNMLEFYGSESTKASTDFETSIPPYVARNTSVPSGREQFGIGASQESFNEECLPSKMDSGKSQTGPSTPPSHGCAASLYLPKIEDFEDMGPLMDTAMQITPETSDYSDLHDSSRRHHLFRGGFNFTTANLSDNLPVCHTMNDLVEQEDVDSSNASTEPSCISNDVNPSIHNIWEASTHADAPVNADSDTSVENDRTRSIGSIEADLTALFAKWTTGKDYDPDCSSTRMTGDVNAANTYDVNNGNNIVASEPDDSQHNKGQVVRDAGSEEMQPRRRKGRPRKKANPSEETQPKRKYRPLRKTDVLPAEVGHSQETEMLDVDIHPGSRDKRTDPDYRYFCIDRTCEASGEKGYRGFRTTSEAKRHINAHSRHLKAKHFQCTFLHTSDRQRRFARPDALRE